MLTIEDVVRDTQALVRIDSQNPGNIEADCASWLMQRLAGAGLEPSVQQVTPGRDNILARVPGRGDAPRLVLLAHLDTVPIGNGWTYPPLDGVIHKGLLYGRGAADMKGGLSVALNLLEELVSTQAVPAGDVILAATVDEEAPDMLGAHALVRDGLVTSDDHVLALEPTGLRLRIAQIGLRWMSLTVHGKMAHAGRAHLGVDANHVMARMVDRLKARIASVEHEDPLLGKPKLTCGVLEGGVGTNVVPPMCRAELDVRLVPPMTISSTVELVRSVAEEVVDEFPGARFDLEGLGAPRPPVRANEDALIVRGLREAFESETGQSLASGGEDGHEAYTDASMVAALTGSETCTVWGPGSTDQAHTANEFVPVEDLAIASRVLARLVADWGE